jgi:hypothetical protein
MTSYMPRGLMVLQNTQTNENDKTRNAKGGIDTDT